MMTHSRAAEIFIAWWSTFIPMFVFSTLSLWTFRTWKTSWVAFLGIFRSKIFYFTMILSRHTRKICIENKKQSCMIKVSWVSSFALAFHIATAFWWWWCLTYEFTFFDALFRTNHGTHWFWFSTSTKAERLFSTSFLCDEFSKKYRTTRWWIVLYLKSLLSKRRRHILRVHRNIDRDIGHEKHIDHQDDATSMVHIDIPNYSPTRHFSALRFKKRIWEMWWKTL